MKAFEVNISKTYGLPGDATLDVMLRKYPLDTKESERRVLRPCVITVPGGGYTWVSTREGEPVASYFMAQGYHTCVLTYSTSPEHVYPTQLLQLAASVDYLRKHADEFSIDPARIYCIGFSAGGHLVGDLAVEWNKLRDRHGVDYDARPSAVGLGYPVISSVFRYNATFTNLLAGYDEAEQARLMEQVQLDKAVTPDTAPCFVWTTAQDGLVPAQNTLAMAMACANAGVPYEAHVFPIGDHGLASGTAEVEVPEQLGRIVGRWLGMCDDFFRLHKIS